LLTSPAPQLKTRGGGYEASFAPDRGFILSLVLVLEVMVPYDDQDVFMIARLLESVYHIVVGLLVPGQRIYPLAIP